jgi:hypothetical protein
MDKSACDLQSFSFMVGVDGPSIFTQWDRSAVCTFKKAERMNKSSKKLGAASYKQTSH